MANATQVDLLIDPLTGKELLQKVKDLDELSREDKAKACGYYTTSKSGKPRVNMMKFLNALIEAEGIQLDSSHNGSGRGGRSASFRITVQSNGNLLIGSAYTKQMGLQPGDEFEITLGRKHIRLKQLGENGAELDDEDE
ncbi:MAG: AbrB family transcriptional regulator [Leptolyngbya sp. DLM2.Bin27]|nr:MAG: AbrB family transcriptional regulator [Leptolyngbya sp. DLM2.Bin27]